MAGIRERVYRHCTLAFDACRKRRAEAGLRFTRADLIREMAKLLPHDEGDEAARARVRAALRNYWPEPKPGKKLELRHDWRLDYLDAFADVVGAPVSRILHLNYEGEAKVDETTYASFFAQAVGRRLTPAQVKAVSGSIREQLDRPGLFELVNDVARAIAHAADPVEAGVRATTAISDPKHAAVWRKKASKSATGQRK